MTTPPHECDHLCVCPIHQTPLFYARSIDDHACQDVNCQYGHGMAGLTWPDTSNWTKQTNR